MPQSAQVTANNNTLHVFQYNQQQQRWQVLHLRIVMRLAVLLISRALNNINNN